MIRNMKDRWEAFSPNAKRVLVVGGIVTVSLGVIAAISHFAPAPPQRADKQAVVKHILTDSDPRSLGIDGLAEMQHDFGLFRLM